MKKDVDRVEKGSGRRQPGRKVQSGGRRPAEKVQFGLCWPRKVELSTIDGTFYDQVYGQK